MLKPILIIFYLITYTFADQPNLWNPSEGPQKPQGPDPMGCPHQDAARHRRATPWTRWAAAEMAGYQWMDSFVVPPKRDVNVDL